MLLLQNTYKAQERLADYCRTGDNMPDTGVNTERVPHYRKLVFNVVKDALDSAYPLTRNLLKPEEWDALIVEFFANHICLSYQIWKMPNELIEYMQKVNHYLLKKYIHLNNLLDLEWIEIELYMQEDKTAQTTPNGKRIVINPENRLLHFEYPVHLKNAKEIKTEDHGNYFLFIHRHPDTGKVLFTNLSVALAAVIEHLQNNPDTLDNLVQLISSKLQITDNSDVKNHLKQFSLQGMKTKLFLGYI